MKRAILTGGSSFLAKYLAQELSTQFDEVIILVRPESASKFVKSENPKITVLFEDVINILNAAENLPKCDAFYHLAWEHVWAPGRSEGETIERNMKISTDCLYAAEKLGCKRFIFAGSQAEYGSLKCEITEQTLCEPQTVYGKTKLAFYEKAVELESQFNFEYIHTRIFSVYGAGDHERTLISSCFNSFLVGETLKVSSCEQMWNFLYVTDCAKMLTKLAFADLSNVKNKIFNIASEDTRVLKDFVFELYDFLGRKGKIEFGDETGISINPDVSKILNVLGWKPEIAFEEGLKKILDYKMKQV